MKNIKLFISFLVSSVLFSCLNLDQPSEQQYVDYQMDSVKEIIITNEKTGVEQKIADKEEISQLSKFLKDSTSYFPSDLIEWNGVKPTHHLKFIREVDTLTLALYPTSDPEKIEVAYFDPEELKIKDSYKEYKRFLIHRDILDFVPNSSD